MRHLVLLVLVAAVPGCRSVPSPPADHPSRSQDYYEIQGGEPGGQTLP